MYCDLCYRMGVSVHRCCDIRLCEACLQRHGAEHHCGDHRRLDDQRNADEQRSAA